ncbi:MAG: hypothetical protein IT168_11390 [Bryobacterales bacterium]|nr:hypothetical protein [Bryobacterales bacterium]
MLSAIGPVSAIDSLAAPSGFAETLRSRTRQKNAQHTIQQLQQLEKLKKIDRDVHAHEQAHLAAAGAYATGGASFQYTTGPDGQRYAVAGEVPIDTSPVPGDPEATIRKARVIQAAASAPADPSSQDRAVAAAAAQMESRAQMDILKKYTENQDARPSLFDLYG